MSFENQYYWICGPERWKFIGTSAEKSFRLQRKPDAALLLAQAVLASLPRFPILSGLEFYLHGPATVMNSISSTISYKMFFWGQH